MTDTTHSKVWVTTRHEAMKVRCPKCRVEAGYHCWSATPGKYRKSAHQERHDEAIRLGAPASLPKY